MSFKETPVVPEVIYVWKFAAYIAVPLFMGTPPLELNFVIPLSTKTCCIGLREFAAD